jgi:hypothetical protein
MLVCASTAFRRASRRGLFTLWTEGIGMTSTAALLVVASTAYAQTTYTTIGTPASLYNPLSIPPTFSTERGQRSVRSK